MSNYTTVSSLNKYLKNKFEQDSKLLRVLLQGEISNFKAHSSGHLYFSLKDETSRINAVMFSSNANKLSFPIENGIKVVVLGSVSVYEATGQYQVYIQQMKLDGLGALHIQFEALKKKLYKEGLFDSIHKQTIPKYPSTIGIITAPTGAVIQDILTTLNRRYPGACIKIFPCLVQGQNACSDIVDKLAIAQSYDLDLIILGRGGGSIEDLWPFNEEAVARAIFASKHPVAVGIGHETDTTISDYVADLTASTPTAIATLVTPDIKDLIVFKDRLVTSMLETMQYRLKQERRQLDNLLSNKRLVDPLQFIAQSRASLNQCYTHLVFLKTHFVTQQKHHLKTMQKDLKISIETKLHTNKLVLGNHIDALNALSPLNVLSRGYTLTRKNNHIITKVQQLKDEDAIEIQYQDGRVEAIVKRRINT